MRTDGPRGHVVGRRDRTSDDITGAVVGGETGRTGDVAHGQEGGGAKEAMRRVDGRSGEGATGREVEARRALSGGARQRPESEGERLARTRGERQLIVAGGDGEAGDGLRRRGRGVTEHLEHAALHVQGGSGADLVVIVRGEVQTERTFVDSGDAGRSQAAVVAGERDQAGAELFEIRSPVAGESRADGASVEIDVAAGDGQQTGAVEICGALRRTLAEDEAGRREGEGAHVEDRRGAVAILGEEQAVEVGRHDGVVGAEVHDRSVTQQERGVTAGGGVEGKDPGGVEVQHRADTGDDEVVAQRHRRSTGEGPDTTRQVRVRRSGRGEAAGDHAGGAGVAEEIETEGGRGDRSRVGDGRPALPLGAEADGRGTSDDAVGRLAGRADEDERTAVQEEVVTAAEAARRTAGGGHGRELEFAAADGDVAGERVDAAQADGAVGLRPAA